MPFEIPIFPLNVVLFPGMVMPLHIFEPRYRLMIRRCLETDRKFGVSLLTDGDEGEGGTLPSWVGTVAEITETQPFPDGRLNIQTIGRRRFRLMSLREEDEYLIGLVNWVDDVKIEDAAPLLAGRVRRVLRRYLYLLAGNVQAKGVDAADLKLPRDPETLSMSVGMLLNLPLEQKQELLEMTSTAARLSYEHSLLRRAEISQLAYSRRLAAGFEKMPFADALGAAAQYVSFN